MIASSSKLLGGVLAALVVAGCGGSSTPPPAEPEPESHQPSVPESSDEEEGPGDGMEVEGLLGSIDIGEAQPAIEARMDDIQRCYSKSINGKSRFVGGRIELLYRIARDGTVKHVRISEGDLGAWAVERCIVDVAAAMKFPRPHGGEAELRFPIDFPSRGRVVLMDPAQADAEVAPLLAELDECQPGPEGVQPAQIVVTLYVGPGGAVRSAGFHSKATDGTVDPTWGDCASAKVLAWKLSDPRGKIWKAQVGYR